MSESSNSSSHGSGNQHHNNYFYQVWKWFIRIILVMIAFMIFQLVVNSPDRYPRIVCYPASIVEHWVWVDLFKLVAFDEPEEVLQHTITVDEHYKECKTSVASLRDSIL